MYLFAFIACYLFLAFDLRGDEPGSSAGYLRPSYVKKDVWERVVPYLLPMDHPLKPVLDDLFSKARATVSVKTMEKAGFENPTPRKWTHLVVTKHPQVPGYVFKVYLDAQRYFNGKKEYDYWITRIDGVNAVKAAIEERGWQDTFKTPAKWIYLLPESPVPPKEFLRKDFILVEEDMDIYDYVENEELWASDLVTEETLFRFYTILEDLGLHDCAKPDNAPFSRDGKIAFIDTQTLYYWPVAYKKMTPHLPKELQPYWKSLTEKPKKRGDIPSAPSLAAN